MRNQHNPTPQNTPESLGTSQSDRALLSDMKSVTFQTKDIFLGQLSEIEKAVKTLPLLLPKGIAYILELVGTTLHVYADKSGINDFEITPGALQKVRMRGGKVEVETGSKELPLVIVHQEPYPRPVEPTSVSRSTSPWRESPPATYYERESGFSSGSESRGSGGSGER